MVVKVKVKHKLLSFFIIAIFFVSCNNIKNTYWKNGNKKSEITYKGDVIDGTAKWWYENGKLKMQSEYANGTLDGRSIRWYENGIKQSEEYYSNGLLEGVSITYNIIGRKVCSENYKNDTLHGSVIQWYPDGKKQIEGQYYYGDIDGRWMYYGRNGDIVGIGEYKNGSGKMKAYYYNGMLKREINYKNSVKDGNEILYDQKGKISEKFLYESGTLISAEAPEN